MQNGWIKLNRKILNWEFWGDAKMVQIFIYCLARANSKPASYKGVTIERGSFTTTAGLMAKENNMSKATLYKCLKALQDSGSIEVQGTNKYTMVKVLKYDEYQ